MDAQSLFTRFDDMNHVRQEVLVNMAYNLGKTRLSGFVKMIEAAETLNYFDMAQQMKDSKWFRQVGQRSMRLYYAMLNGEW
jgi:lysozyme